MSTLNSSIYDTEKIIQSVSRYIIRNQLESGAIPWFKDHILDPWDHCEAIMALNISGHYDQALQGLSWLKHNQNPDGTWYSKYFCSDDGDLDAFKIEAHFVTYPSTALWHHYLCTNDVSTLTRFFVMIQRATDYVIAQQTEEGDIQWANSDKETLPRDALLTACSSILRSFECAINIAEILKEPTTHWREAHIKLAEALKNKPWRFDRTWESKARFSMDWFYPILSGVYSKEEAIIRLNNGKQKFIVDGLGCKCVSDEPWVTIAESCEFIIASIAAGEQQEAKEMFHQLQRWRDSDGAYWTGYVYRDDSIWPEEKTTWTAAAISLAADAIEQVTPASGLFVTPSGLSIL